MTLTCLKLTKTSIKKYHISLKVHVFQDWNASHMIEPWNVIWLWGWYYFTNEIIIPPFCIWAKHIVMLIPIPSLIPLRLTLHFSHWPPPTFISNIFVCMYPCRLFLSGHWSCHSQKTQYHRTCYYFSLFNVSTSSSNRFPRAQNVYHRLFISLKSMKYYSRSNIMGINYIFRK